MKIVALFFILVVPHALFAQLDSAKIKKEIIKFIKDDFRGKTIFKHDSDFVVVDQSIKFELLSVSESFINKKFIAGFNYGNDTLKKNNRYLIRKAEDSLQRLSDKLNANLIITHNVPCPKLSSNKVLIFLTPVNDCKIYAEAILSAAVMCDKGNFEFFGESFTYFLVQSNQKPEFYTGVVTNN